jgi:hypothetical protein
MQFESHVVLPNRLRRFELHTGFLVLLVCSAAYRGSLYYRYAFGKKLQKEMKMALQAKIKKKM